MKHFFLSLALLLPLQAFAQMEQIPGHVSGGGEELELEVVTKLRDRFLDFLRSPSFPVAYSQAEGIDLAYLDYIVENLRITSVEKLREIRENDRERAMLNYWEGNIPRLDFIPARLDAETKPMQLFIHETLGLLRYEGQTRIVDDNYAHSAVYVEALEEFEEGRFDLGEFRQQRQKLFACYQKLYIPSPTRGDFWRYSANRASGQPGDAEPEYIMLPTQFGAYFVSPHLRHPSFSVRFTWGEGALIFLPDEKSLREDLPSTGAVITYLPSAPLWGGMTAHRYEVVSNNIDEYLGEVLLVETIEHQLKKEDPRLFAELEARGELREEVLRRKNEFAGGNLGTNLMRYKLKALTHLVAEGYRLEDEEPAIRRLRDIIVSRIFAAPTHNAEVEDKLKADIAYMKETGWSEENIRIRGEFLDAVQARWRNAVEPCLSVGDPVITRALQEVGGEAAKPRTDAIVPYHDGQMRRGFLGRDYTRSAHSEVSIPEPESEITVPVYTPPARGDLKPEFHYKMPKRDRARKHDSWDDSIAITFYVIGETEVKSEHYDFENKFLVRTAEDPVLFHLDVNCHVNDGSLVFKRANIDPLEAFRPIITEAPQAWFQFDRKAECDAFSDYLRRNSNNLSESNPLEVVVDKNHFYRVIEVRGYSSR